MRIDVLFLALQKFSIRLGIVVVVYRKEAKQETKEHSDEDAGVVRDVRRLVSANCQLPDGQQATVRVRSV